MTRNLYPEAPPAPAPATWRAAVTRNSPLADLSEADHRYLSDAALAFGKTAYHLTYDLAPKAGGNVSFQFGVGGMTNTHESLGLGAGVPDLTRKTNLSAYANGVLSMKNDMTANFGLWYLRQTGSVPAFTVSGVPVSAISATQSVLQWTLSFGRSF